MSEQPRDAGTGQFVANNEDNYFGLDAVERAQGLSAVGDPPAPDPQSGPDWREEEPELPRILTDHDDPVEDAVDIGYLTPAEDPEPTPIKVFTDASLSQEMAPEKTLTLDQAAELKLQHETNAASYVEGLDLINFVSTVDQARADVVKASPEDAKTYGLDPKEVAANAGQPEAQQQQPDQQLPLPTAAKPDSEGQDVELSRALENPKVREFLESNLAQAEAAKQQFLSATEAASRATLSRLDQLLAHTNIGKLPTVEARQAAFEDLARTEPQTYLQAVAEMNVIANNQQVLAQQQQAQANARSVQVSAYAAQEGKAYDEWAAQEGINPRDMSAKAEQYLEGLGVSKEQLSKVALENPIIFSSTFQKVLTDAIRYQQIKAAPRAVPTRQVPTVLKPGSSATRSAKEVNIAALENELNRTGSEEAAWRLYQARNR